MKTEIAGSPPSPRDRVSLARPINVIIEGLPTPETQERTVRAFAALAALVILEDVPEPLEVTPEASGTWKQDWSNC